MVLGLPKSFLGKITSFNFSIHGRFKRRNGIRETWNANPRQFDVIYVFYPHSGVIHAFIQSNPARNLAAENIDEIRIHGFE